MPLSAVSGLKKEHFAAFSWGFAPFPAAESCHQDNIVIYYSFSCGSVGVLTNVSCNRSLFIGILQNAAALFLGVLKLNKSIHQMLGAWQRQHWGAGPHL